MYSHKGNPRFFYSARAPFYVSNCQSGLLILVTHIAQLMPTIKYSDEFVFQVNGEEKIHRKENILRFTLH